MNINEIIDKLCNHDISKHEAKDLLKDKTQKLRQKESIEFTVKEVGFCCKNNHGYLELILPYQYDKIKGKVRCGDKVFVNII